MEKEINTKTVRFSDAPWYEPNIPVIIGGVGSIGSHLAYFLGRQECDLYIYDMDLVDEVNIAGQLFRCTDIRKDKTEATKELVKLLSDNSNVETYGKFGPDSMAGEIMFSCFDNMAARKVFFEKWCLIEGDNKIFIDGRTAAENGQVFIVTPNRIEEYKKYLFDDSEVKDLPCTYKSTTYCASFVASLMTAAFNNYKTNLKLGYEMADLPFKSEYSLQLFNLHTEEVPNPVLV